MQTEWTVPPHLEDQERKRLLSLLRRDSVLAYLEQTGHRFQIMTPLSGPGAAIARGSLDAFPPEPIRDSHGWTHSTYFLFRLLLPGDIPGPLCHACVSPITGAIEYVPELEGPEGADPFGYRPPGAPNSPDTTGAV
jgi:hypothetical protein